MVFIKTIENCESTNSSNSSPIRRKIKLTQRLDELIEMNKGYQFIQKNGQRIFEPCASMTLNPPQKGCEVFIGKIPKYMYEDYLIPLFQQVGPIYSFRLMLDFSERNRGFAFASYFFAHHAREAIERYNGYVLANGMALSVLKSIDNRRLFVGNIPRTKTLDDVQELFHTYVDGLVDVILYSSWFSPAENRGFAFLEFESHSAASIARRQFHPRNLVVWSHALYVDWADPIPEVDPVVMQQVTILYVKNLPIDFSNDEVYALFRIRVGPHLIRKISKTLNYAFVHCYDRTSAEIVMRSLTGLAFNDQLLEIEWARPRQYSSRFRSSQPPDNYCLSVPSRSRKKIKEIIHARKASSLGTSEMESKPNSSTSSSEYWV